MSDLINLKVDIDGPLRGIKLLREQSLPFLYARTLTMVAQQGQANLKVDEETHFTIRNDWTTRNTKIIPATKQALVATVYTDTTNRATGAPDYLLRQEEGGERVAYGGRKYIAVPTKKLRQLAGGPAHPIPYELSATNLLNLAKSGGKTMTRRGKMRQLGVKIRGMYFFPVTFKSGSHGILGRESVDKDAYVMYILAGSVKTLKRLTALKDVEIAVDDLDKHFTRAAAEIKVNDALRGTGLNVKF